MTKPTTQTPRQRFKAMPGDAQAIVTQEAETAAIPVEAMFPDYVTIQAGNKARKAAVRRLLDGGHVAKDVARWFGVTYVAVMSAMRGR